MPLRPLEEGEHERVILVEEEGRPAKDELCSHFGIEPTPKKYWIEGSRETILRTDENG